jgi:succinyl-CoA synthetase beta subunit
LGFGCPRSESHCPLCLSPSLPARASAGIKHPQCGVAGRTGKFVAFSAILLYTEASGQPGIIYCILCSALSSAVSHRPRVKLAGVFVMKIHEFQAKDILARFGVPVPRGEVVEHGEDAGPIAEKLGGTVVVKAQIHAGGRGKGGGVKLAHTPEEAVKLSKTMLGMKLVTHQTGPEGRIVRRVLVEEGLEIARELYLGVVIDRETGKLVIMVSSEGGVEIEVVAAEHPERILKEFIDQSVGLQPFQARKLAYGLHLDGHLVSEASKLFTALCQAFTDTDASLAEINPLVVTKDNRLLALDAKMNFDDNALYRHPDIQQLRDLNEEDPLEVKASEYKLNYIRLDGNVGCMVNGAGLAMATMDIIQHAGGRPANFLDVGGGANEDQVRRGFEIILSDPNVKAVLVNIFGGIMRCDIVANGVVAAAKSLSVKVPVVVRLEGTNVELGQQVLRESGLNFTVANGMSDAAQKVVKLAQ